LNREFGRKPGEDPAGRFSAAGPEGRGRSRLGTFNLLGFTHSWAKSRKGHWVVKQKTVADRFRRALKRIANWCRQYRHGPVRKQSTALKRKLLGHFVYFGITGNFRALRNFRHRAIGVWQKGGFF